MEAELSRARSPRRSRRRRGRSLLQCLSCPRAATKPSSSSAPAEPVTPESQHESTSRYGARLSRCRSCTVSGPSSSRSEEKSGLSARKLPCAAMCASHRPSSAASTFSAVACPCGQHLGVRVAGGQRRDLARAALQLWAHDDGDASVRRRLGLRAREAMSARTGTTLTARSASAGSAPHGTGCSAAGGAISSGPSPRSCTASARSSCCKRAADASSAVGAAAMARSGCCRALLSPDLGVRDRRAAECEPRELGLARDCVPRTAGMTANACRRRDEHVHAPVEPDDLDEPWCRRARRESRPRRWRDARRPASGCSAGGSQHVASNLFFSVQPLPLEPAGRPSVGDGLVDQSRLDVAASRGRTASSTSSGGLTAGSAKVVARQRSVHRRTQAGIVSSQRFAARNRGERAAVDGRGGSHLDGSQAQLVGVENLQALLTGLEDRRAAPGDLSAPCRGVPAERRGPRSTCLSWLVRRGPGAVSRRRRHRGRARRRRQERAPRRLRRGGGGLPRQRPRSHRGAGGGSRSPDA